MPFFGDEFGGQFGGDSDLWGEYENALRQWVILATGLDNQHVIRADQDGPRPSTPFCEVRIGDMLPLGAVDGVTNEYDPGGAAGEEIVQTARGQREFSATVRAFTDSAVGPATARALLAKAQTSLALSVVKDIFETAGMTCFDRGSIQWVPGILDTRWEGRAMLIVRCYVEETATYRTGYITSAEVTDQSVTPEETFVVDGTA